MAAPGMSAPSSAKSCQPAAQAPRGRAESIAVPALLCAGAALAAGWALLQLHNRHGSRERAPGLLDLPEDVALAILQQVSPRDRAALGATCRHLREAIFQQRCSQGEVHLGVTGPAALARFARHASTHSLGYIRAFGSPLSHSQAACLASIPSLEVLVLQGQLGLDIQALAPLSNLTGLLLGDIIRTQFGPGPLPPIKHLAAQYPSLAAELSDVLPPLEYPAEALAAPSAADAWIPVWGPPQRRSLQPTQSSLVLPKLELLALGGIVHLPKGALPALEELILSRFCVPLGTSPGLYVPWQAGPSKDARGWGAQLQALETQCFVEDLFASIGHPIKRFTLVDLPLTLASLACILKGVTDSIELTTHANLCIMEESSTLTELKLCVEGPITAEPARSLRLQSFPALQRLELLTRNTDMKVPVLPALTHLHLRCGAVGLLLRPRLEERVPTLRQLVLQDARVVPDADEVEPMHWVYRPLQALPLLESLRLINIIGQERLLQTFLHRGLPARLDRRAGEPDSVLWTSTLP